MEEFITNPEPELNVPPLVPVIVGVGFEPDLPYYAAAETDLHTSQAVIEIFAVEVVAHKLLDDK